MYLCCPVYNEVLKPVYSNAGPVLDSQDQYGRNRANSVKYRVRTKKRRI